MNEGYWNQRKREERWENEQKLIDIMFQVSFMIHEDEHIQQKSREGLTDWIRLQLKECGFITQPEGASWARLKEIDR